ncbi:MAG TPA: hypothetical protein VIZ62_07720 [Nitrososphaeraceae archaeon]
MYPERYADVYNKISQNITDNTINANRRINDLVLGSTETFNNYESVQKYFNFVNKIENLITITNFLLFVNNLVSYC